MTLELLVSKQRDEIFESSEYIRCPRCYVIQRAYCFLVTVPLKSSETEMSKLGDDTYNEKTMTIMLASSEMTEIWQNRDGKFRSEKEIRCPTCYMIRNISKMSYFQNCEFCNQNFMLEMEYKEIDITELDPNKPISCAACGHLLEFNKIIPGACPKCKTGFEGGPKIAIIVSPPLKRAANELPSVQEVSP